MRILYGLSGDGYGHSSRAKVVGGYLKEWGHDVKMLTYGRAVDVLKDDFDVFKVSGMEIQYAEGVIDRARTLANGLAMVADNVSEMRRFHRMMMEYGPDLCISDMEPIVPIMRFWYRKPLICIDNQHRMTNLRIDVPAKYQQEYLAARAVTEGFVSRADHFIITSFTDVPVKPRYTNKTTIVPPMIRPEVRNAEPTSGEKILVYLTRENQGVLDVLKGVDEDFVVFGYDAERQDGNLEFRTKEYFLDELKGCKGIIATAGFTLMSEAIYLRKPYLAIPLKGQFEQVLNALFLKQAGYGDYSDSLTRDDVDGFISGIDRYRGNLAEGDMDLERIPRALRDVIDRLQ
jgi:uncharacterized protein (TIGR00661 family)